MSFARISDLLYVRERSRKETNELRISFKITHQETLLLIWYKNINSPN